jgi:hypothetical protein
MAPCGRHRAGSDQSEVRDPRREARELKEVVAEQALKIAPAQKKHDRGWGEASERRQIYF